MSDPVGTEPPAHTPVMIAEVVSYLGDRRIVIDMTLGAGRTCRGAAACGRDVVIGVDRDPAALALARERLAAFGDRVRYVAGPLLRGG